MGHRQLLVQSQDGRRLQRLLGALDFLLHALHLLFHRPPLLGDVMVELGHLGLQGLQVA